MYMRNPGVMILRSHSVCLACEMSLLFGDGFDRDSRAANEGIELPTALVLGLGINNDRRLYEGCCRHATRVSLCKRACIGLGVLFLE